MNVTFRKKLGGNRIRERLLRNVIPLFVHITHFLVTKTFDIWYRINPHRFIIVPLKGWKSSNIWEH